MFNLPIPMLHRDWCRHPGPDSAIAKGHVTVGIRGGDVDPANVTIHIHDRVKRRRLAVELHRTDALVLANRLIDAYLGTHEHDA